MIDFIQDKNIILSIYAITIYDSNHARERFKERYDLDYRRFHGTIRYGMEEIKRLYNLQENQYMIISKKTGLRIPLQLINYGPNYGVIGKVPTVLSPEFIHNIKNDIDIYLEKKNVYARIPLIEQRGISYNYYVDGEEYFTDFVEIWVE